MVAFLNKTINYRTSVVTSLITMLFVDNSILFNENLMTASKYFTLSGKFLNLTGKF